MTKYLLKVIKIKDRDQSEGIPHKMSLYPSFEEEMVLFSGEMDADSAVEVIDHLYKLKIKQ